MGLLGWEWGQATNRVGRWGVLRINRFDEAINVIGVNAYNGGLKRGFAIGGNLPEKAKSAYLHALRRHTGARPGQWTRIDQISFVIDLAAFYRAHYLGPE